MHGQSIDMTHQFSMEDKIKFVKAVSNIIHTVTLNDCFTSLLEKLLIDS